MKKVFDVSMDPDFLSGKNTKNKLFYELIYNLTGI